LLRAEGEQRRQRDVHAGGISHEHDLLGLISSAQQMVIAGEDVVSCRRKGMLGR